MSAASDRREFVRLAVELPLHPKLVELDDAPLAGWLYVTGLCYAGQHLTDGELPVATVVRLAGVDPEIGAALIDAGLWHPKGHRCPRCRQPSKRGRIVVHDYLAHQRSEADATALRTARREAGAKGAAKRWRKPGNGDGKRQRNSHTTPTTEQAQAVDEPPASPSGDRDPDQPQQATAMASAIAPASQVPRQIDGNAMAEGEEEEEHTPFGSVCTPARVDARTSARAGARTRGPATLDELAAHAVKPTAYQLIQAWHTQRGRPYPTRTLRALSTEVDKLLADRGEPDAIRAALDLWHGRTGASPGLLPHLYVDAVKARDGATASGRAQPSTGASARGEKVRGWLALAETTPGRNPFAIGQGGDS